MQKELDYGFFEVTICDLKRSPVMGLARCVRGYVVGEEHQQRAGALSIVGVCAGGEWATPTINDHDASWLRRLRRRQQSRSGTTRSQRLNKHKSPRIRTLVKIHLFAEDVHHVFLIDIDRDSCIGVGDV